LLPNRTTMGIYYDDPEAVPQEELRYAVGSILAEGEGKGDPEPDPAEMERMLAEGFRVTHLPRPEFAVLATFPYTTPFSVALGANRVYPALKSFIASKGLCAYPAVEIYKDAVIQYLMPLSRQEEWYVSEFNEEEVSVATTVASTTDGKRRVSTAKEVVQKDEEGFVRPTSPRDR